MRPDHNHLTCTLMCIHNTYFTTHHITKSRQSAQTMLRTTVYHPEQKHAFPRGCICAVSCSSHPADPSAYMPQLQSLLSLATTATTQATTADDHSSPLQLTYHTQAAKRVAFGYHWHGAYSRCNIHTKLSQSTTQTAAHPTHTCFLIASSGQSHFVVASRPCTSAFATKKPRCRQWCQCAVRHALAVRTTHSCIDSIG
jgi:hypothetical protein